ncbi:MAG: gamma-glutamyl-gamma-aminobutyrate hydrolase family protein [Actinomycetota bacterium]|nr:gamma-glutamyl-gamma-aminobutyrate hydrolase family protein [Actinomycetota bacterium]
MRPLIGVTTSEVRPAEQVHPTAQGDPPRHEMALGLTYLQAIEAAGGLPVVMPPLELEAVEPLLDRLSGVCLSGGPDLDPAAYDERRHPELGPVEPHLDHFELELARRADARGLPILAVCRGAQALNVARGGTLHQHLPDRPGVTLDHRQQEPCTAVTHDVTIAAGSKLARTMKRRSAPVNSFHHQAVNRLGGGLRAVAWSSDGVIEGVEAPARGFLLGVQWHAECLIDRPEHAALFTGLVTAAAAFEAEARPERAA